jgi:cytochrome c oxidase subunit 3
MEEFTEREKIARSKKMMLWFGIVSLIMGFAGWTSAYIVSSSREDWLSDLSLPTEFYYSALVLLISSLSYIMAKKAVKEDRSQQATLYLVATFLLGVLFVSLQISGFYTFIDMGYYFTGPTSNVTVSFIYIIAIMHIVHLIAGFISLSVVIFNQIKGKYDSQNLLGLELGATFWHFLDLLWIYLVLFFHFFN